MTQWEALWEMSDTTKGVSKSLVTIAIHRNQKDSQNARIGCKGATGKPGLGCTVSWQRWQKTNKH